MIRLKYKHILFIIVVVFSFLFRISNLDYIEFKADEAINLFLAARPIFGHPFPPGSTTSSIGILNPPLVNYLLLPFTIISLDPRIISFFIGLINSLSIGLFFLLIKKYYGVTTAFIGGVLVAFSPWSIIYSRKIWAQDFLFPLAIFLFISIYKILLEKKYVYWAIYSLISLFLIQIHQSSIFFIALITGFLLIQKVRINIKYATLGLILGVFPLIPYIKYQIANNCPDCKILFQSRKNTPTIPIGTLYLPPLQIVNQGSFYTLLGEDTLTFANKFTLIYKLRRLFYMEYVLIPAGMLIFLLKFPKHRFLVYATILLPILYFFLKIVPHIHYYIIITPLLFLFLSYLLSFLFQSKNIYYKIIALSLFLSIVSISFSFNIAFFKLLKNQKTLKGDYGDAFVVTYEKAKNKLKKYKKDPAYEEMVLASYLPNFAIKGDFHRGNIIYDYKKTQIQLPLLEKRLEKVPIDPRVQNELIAFYSQYPIKKDTIKLLENKSNKLIGYKTVLDEVYKIYTQQKL